MFLIFRAFKVMGAFSKVEIERPKLLIVLKSVNSFDPSSSETPCLIRLIVIFSGDPIYSLM